MNGLGLLSGKIHSAKTPDLYEHNVHNPLGWALTLIVLLQCIIGAIQKHASVDVMAKTSSEEYEAFIPISAEAMEEHRVMQGRHEREHYRFSRDSGQGTEPESPSSCSVILSDQEPEKIEEETMSVNGDGRSENRWSSVVSQTLLCVSRMLSSRTLRILNLLSDMTDILILPLGFVAMISGMVIYGGVFVRASLVLESDAPQLTVPSVEAMCSMGLHIPSRAASSSGMVC